VRRGRRLAAWHRDALAMAGLVLALCVITVWLGERIGVNGGQGWDGMAYTEWAREFWAKVMGGVTRYHSQRVLPSALVHHGLRLVGLPRDVPHVIAGFQVLNTIALVGSAALWAHLGRAMGWSRPAVWAGFVALFGGFANARHALYYPTLTDPTAFALGMVMVWAYLVRRPWVLWWVAALGIVTWPALPPLAMVLFVFPRPGAEVAPAAPGRPRAIVAAAVSVVAAIAFLAVALHFLAHPVPGVGDDKFAQWVRRDVLVLTLGSLLAMLALGWYAVLGQPVLWNARGYLTQLGVRRTALACASVAVLLIGRALWLRSVGTRGDGPSGAQFLCEHTLAAIRGPLWGLVHQVVYFGPIILVAALYWRQLAAVCARWGPSAVLALAMVLAFAAGSNSRQWNHLLPFLVAAAIAATAPRWTGRTVAVFALLSLIWSKLWLRIGYDVHDNWLRFPNQRYFMNHGPYANDTMYLAHAIAAALTLVVLAVLLGRRGPSPSRGTADAG